MGFVYAAAGVVVIVATMTDILFTTLTTHGGGPITARLSEAVWKRLLRVHRRRPSHRLLANAGVLIVVSLIALWLALLCLGWALLFSADAGSVVSAQTGEPADAGTRTYFVSYTFFTLGLGDYQPKGALWELATTLTAANGLVGVTLVITYIVPIVFGAAQRRTIATYISALGPTPEEILVRAWDGRGFPGLQQHMIALTASLAQLSQQHRVYPALHYFHSAHPDASIAVRLATLDEALLLLECRVEPACRPPPAVLRPLRQVIAALLGAIHAQYDTPHGGTPPPPTSDALRRAGVFLVDDDRFAADFAACAPHRHLLLGFVLADGWTWNDVVRG